MTNEPCWRCRLYERVRAANSSGRGHCNRLAIDIGPILKKGNEALVWVELSVNALVSKIKK